MHHKIRRHATTSLTIARKWLKKHQRVLVITISSVLLVVIMVQLLYPSGRGLPFAHVGDSQIFFASRDDVVSKLHSLQESGRIAVKVDDKTTTESLTTAGITIAVDATADKALNYPLWQRFIPLTLLFSKLQSQPFDVAVNEEKVSSFAGKIAESQYKAAKNATLIIEGETVKVQNDEAGAEIQPSDIITRLKSVTYHGQTTNVSLSRTEVAVDRKTSDIQAVKKQAETIIATATSITVADKKYDVSKAELASWLTFTDGDNNALVLSLSDEKMSTYLASISKELTIAPGVTKINTVDGQEVSRVTGADGRGIDVEAVKKSIQAAVMANQPSVAIKTGFVTLKPIEQFNKQFTATQKGLQAYIADLAATKNMNIAVQQIGGSGWSASAKASDQVISASTYKLFVAYVLFEKIKTGGYSWEQPMLDTTIAGCFDRMIVRSDNTCAEKFIDMITTKVLDDTIHAGGFSSATSFRSTVATKTSAADQLRLVVGLQNGTIIGGSDRDRLLSAMSRQIYRAGIPSGTSGSVQNKVGFFNEVLNDSGIVTTSRGTYAISIMTRNSTWGEIAQITRTIESLMYP